MRQLYPAIEPAIVEQLDVGDGHSVYVEQCGAADGIPVAFLHGGPGGGCLPHHRRYFDPSFWRIVLLDQRGAGRSTPTAEITDNTTAHLVADLERLRQHLGMDLKRAPAKGDWPAEAAADIERVQAIWAEARARFGTGGPFLFGQFTAADAMYAPVVTRFHRYGVPLDRALAAYRDAVLALPAMQEWTGKFNPRTLTENEVLHLYAAAF